MLIIHCIKSGELWDLYYRDEFGPDLDWFGCLAGYEDPRLEKSAIYSLFAICEPELAKVYHSIDVYVYERKK